MSWNEVSTETSSRGIVHVTYRCNSCRRWAVATSLASPSPCVCNGGPVKVAEKTSGVDPGYRPGWPWSAP